MKVFSILVIAAACMPKPIPTDRELLLGDVPVVIHNDADQPICSFSLSAWAEGQNRIIELLPNGPSDDGTTPLAKKAELTAKVKPLDYQLTIQDCLKSEYVSQKLKVTGPLVVSIGAGHPDVPPGYTLVGLDMHDQGGGGHHHSGSCSPAYASEVDPTKCCSGKIDTKDNGSHYFCKP